ncbi:hypothetical protein [Aeromonas phage AS-szw]|uniref:Uncharacterized protein n=1 Tax=Aeromonas phage AS-szw TaxID=2026114 RepID=A0A291LDT9_9CAUD|nr:hypothetical protein [Aeromonas phage AS-szw]
MSMYKFRSDYEKEEFISVGEVFNEFEEDGINSNKLIVDFLKKTGRDEFELVPFVPDEKYVIDLEETPDELKDLIYHFSQADIENYLVEVE